ncbi:MULTISPECIES: ATP-dependent nuclease [unclassified Phaeobacter]|uniref:ATP-dependent nuclease n=1 Tax=unclassified Phaeobacter TaxID=2621772 RepID=UPI003A86648E
MITEVRIQNFLRISDQIRLQLSPMTVLVGENGAGKSSVLKALHWAIRCATLADTAKKVTLEQMDYVPSKDFLDLGHKLKLQNASGGRKTTVTLIDEDFQPTTISVSAARNDAGVKVEINGPLTTELTNDSSPSTAFIPGLSGLSEEETILATPVLHRRASSGEGGSALRQVLLQLSGGAEGTGTEYRELTDLSHWVGKVLPGVRFWIKFDRLRDRNIDVRFMTPDMKVSGQSDRVAWKSIEMAGTGFLQVVQIFAYLLYFKPKILLVDEPDAHLHPTRQQALSRALSEATHSFPSTQIIVSTHSPSLVRSLPSDTRVHWILDGKVKAQGDLVREKMGWSALDKELIIFSEDGNTKYLEGILTARPNLQNRCLIWPTFGKDALPNGPKARSIAKRMDVRVVVHRDRDFMSDEDVEAWAGLKSYDDCDVRYWVPTGSDIESQFLSPEHIARTLEVSETIAQEIIRTAFETFSEETVMTEFSAAYQAAVSKLPNVEGRNPIARWAALGGFCQQTIKGKNFLAAVQKACASVLPNYGLGTKIGNRNKICQSSPDSLVADGLLDLLQNSLDEV